MKKTTWAFLAFLVLSATGCATRAPKDYTAFRASNPKSILILPPINQSPDPKASLVVYSMSQRPLAESGFYVFPVSLVHETFKNNGLTVPDDIHQVDTGKLREIFGADAAMYVTIKDYGTRYFVLGSASIVTADAKLIDLRNKQVLWTGSATASSEENRNNQGGLAGLLVGAIVKQIIGTLADESRQVAAVTTGRLLSADMPNGVLYGPYHASHGKSALDKK